MDQVTSTLNRLGEKKEMHIRTYYIKNVEFVLCQDMRITVLCLVLMSELIYLGQQGHLGPGEQHTAKLHGPSHVLLAGSTKLQCVLCVSLYHRLNLSTVLRKKNLKVCVLGLNIINK